MYLEYADAGLLGRKFTKKVDVLTGAESVRFRRIVNLFRALQMYSLFTLVMHSVQRNRTVLIRDCTLQYSTWELIIKFTGLMTDFLIKCLA